MVHLKGRISKENDVNDKVHRWNLQCEVNGVQEHLQVIEWNQSEEESPTYYFLSVTETWQVSPVSTQFETSAVHSQSVGSSLHSPMPGKDRSIKFLLVTFCFPRTDNPFKILGKVVKVLVKEGDQVEAGQSLLILEAMKMEHTIKAPVRGKVKGILYRAGDLVEENKLLITLTTLEK
jgi:hypothetical protein